ncbi:glycosyltransferase family 2 protein [Paenibacillus cremeus]|uniref:Glycosyltransferase n=1 Tax=Paenibacillus cremeus TaxID=2163881 RepID=A0A559KEB0_9BACL|nr:glycosyltransferase family 2 protein [Paenibacillus cremeus]TVY10465.1 glycosyltransferase [Paenibacillus cremeus]
MRTAQAERYYESIIAALKEQRYTEAERGAIEEIRRAPLAPQAWTLLGEALLHQGYGHAARKTFGRAWLLDPEAAWVEQVEQALKRTQPGPSRADIDELLQVKRVTVTVGIIARDEERTIRRCLASLQGAVDDIVVVDCESKDATASIAAEFPGVKIVRTSWNNDFSALRNAGLAVMNTDWVLWIDADEELHPDDVTAVREVAGLYDDMDVPSVLYIWQVNRIAGSVRHEFSQTRMFPLRYGLRYHGRVHEQVGPREGSIYSQVTYRKPVRIRLLHDGYEPDIVKQKDKISRNLRLLEMMVKEEPDNPGWWMYYARESLAAGQTEQALEAIRRTEETALHQPRFGRLLDALMLKAKIHLAARRWDEVEEACMKALELDADFPDAQFYLATAKLHRGAELHREAEKLLRQSKDSFKRYRGTVSPDHEIAQWKADVSLADIARSVGKFADATQMYQQVQARAPYVHQIHKPLQRMEEQYRKLQELMNRPDGRSK